MIAKLVVWFIGAITISINGSLAILNLGEFYKIGIRKQVSGYPFGGEGPVPYYYKTAELYSTVSLVWGLLFLSALAFVIWAMLKRKKIVLTLGVTLFLVLALLIHGLIGTS